MDTILRKIAAAAMKARAEAMKKNSTPIADLTEDENRLWNALNDEWDKVQAQLGSLQERKAKLCKAIVERIPSLADQEGLLVIDGKIVKNSSDMEGGS